MNLPFEYDQRRRRRVRRHHADHHRFRTRPRRHPAGAARPDDVLRARHAQRPARDSRRVVAHGAVGRGDGDRRPQHRHLHAAGDGVPVRDDGRGRSAEIRRVASEIVDARQVSGRPRRRALDHARPSSRAVAAKHPGLSVLQIDAHADLRDTFMGTPHNHACAMRRVARVRAERRRSASAACRPRRRRPRPSLPTDDLLRLQHAATTRTGSIAWSTR